MPGERFFRQEKSTPGRDAWITLRLGLIVFLLLVVLLPVLFR